MSLPIDPQDNEIISALERLQPTPPRNQQAGEEGRANFLAIAEGIKPAGQVGLLSRIPMPLWVSRALVAAVIALVVLLSGTGISAYAAQDALPGDQFYGFKIWLEDARLFFAISPQQAFDLHLDFANNRLEELEILLDNHQDVDQAKHDFEGHYQSAIALADQVDKDGLQKLEETHQKYLALFPDSGELSNPDIEDSEESPGSGEGNEDSDVDKQEDEELDNEVETENGSGVENNEGKEGQREGMGGEQQETEEPDEGGEHEENEEEDLTVEPDENNEHDEED